MNWNPPPAALAVILAATASFAGEPASKPVPVPENLACRFAERVQAGENSSRIEPLIDVNLNTRSSDPKDSCFETAIASGRKLGACVREVRIQLPGDRFNVTVFLDGRRHFRTGHMDLDIYVEMGIDGRTYILHCMPEIE